MSCILTHACMHTYRTHYTYIHMHMHTHKHTLDTHVDIHAYIQHVDIHTYTACTLTHTSLRAHMSIKYTCPYT